MSLKYLGRTVNVLSGFQGVAPGSTASLSMPVGQRTHRMNIQCTGIYFSATSGTAYPLVFVKTANPAATAGTNTLTPTIVNGQLTALTFTAGGTASTNVTVGDLVTYVDPTGFGHAAYVATVTGGPPGAIATINLTGAGASKGVACPIDPRILILNLKQMVNGQVIRDITPTSIIGICNDHGYKPQYGSLPLLYTEPWRNFLRDNEANSWDLTGQNTNQYQFQLNPNVQSPGLSGVMEFDKKRNARVCTAQNQAYLGTDSTGKPWAIGTKVPFLAPIGQHQIGAVVPAGKFDVTTVNFSYPILALYIAGSLPGNIYGIDILADGNLIHQVSAKDMAELQSQYNYQTSNALYAPLLNGGGFGGQSGTVFPAPGLANDETPMTTPNGVLGAESGNSSSPFAWDAVVRFEESGRFWEGIQPSASFIVRVYSNAAQTLTIVSETSPGAYLG